MRYKIWSTILVGSMFFAAAPGLGAPAKPAPKKPAAQGAAKNPGAAASKASKAAQAAKLAADQARLSESFTDCEAFKSSPTKWNAALVLQDKIEELLGIELPKVNLEKGEFETTLEHEARVKRTLNRFFGDADNVVFLVKADSGWQSYDADKQVLTIRPYTKSATATGSGGIVVFETVKRLGSQIGQTRMGVKFRYENVVRYERFLHLSSLEDRLYRSPSDVGLEAVTLPMSRQEAINARSSLVFVVLGSMQAPYMLQGDDEDVASLDEPESWYTRSEVWSVRPKCAYLYDLSSRTFVHTYIEQQQPAAREQSAAGTSVAKTPVSVVTAPDWLRRPTSSDMERYYPSAALSAEKNGEVRMTCKVNAEGLLEECRASSETPAGFGFGQAALRMAGLFKMKTETREGEPVTGASVDVPVSFKLQ